MVHPGIGLRLGFGGYQAKGYSLENEGFAYKRVDTDLYRTKFGILHLHGDVMLNFTNLFCGYREDRLYNAIPYVSIGYLRGIDNNENELSGGIRIHQPFPFEQGLGLEPGIERKHQQRRDGRYPWRKEYGRFCSHHGRCNLPLQPQRLD